MCTITLTAYKRACRTVSGIKNIYLIDKAAREAVTEITLSVTSGALTIANDGGEVSAYKITPVQNNATLTAPPSGDVATNTAFVTQSLDFYLHGYTAVISSLFTNLMKGRFEALVEFTNGTLVYVGLDDNGLQLTGGDATQSGTAKGENEGSQIVLTCESAIAPPVLASLASFTDAFDVTEA